jgi:HEAT repeat protein
MAILRSLTSLRWAGVFLLLPLYLVFGQAPEPSVHDRAEALINESLKDKNPDTRMQAVQALSLAASREPWLSQVKGMLADKDVPVRVATITSLLDLKNVQTIGTLKIALDDEVPEVSFAAAKALWLLKDPSGEAALKAVLTGETKTASGFLTRQKRDALRMFHTPKTLFLFALTEGLGIVPIPGIGQGVSSMQGILSDPGISGRAAAALLLSSDKSPETLQALREALADKDSSMRAAAAHALALRNDPSLQPDLARLLDDRKEAVRLRAAAGWLRLEAIRTTPQASPPTVKQGRSKIVR